ncbi:MAG: DUF433 domain-containing protein [Bacteroidota bacterium]
MDTSVAYPHIEVDEAGIARVGATRLKVLHLVAAQRAYGWSPAELHFQYPSLSMAQVHAALGYYWDHREALDAALDAALESAERARPGLKEPEGLRARLRSLRDAS